MYDILKLFLMAGNYENRAIDRFENDNFVIDTCYVTDREPPYETAIKHKDFYNNNWIVLGWSETREKAQKYHNEMVDYYLSNDVDIIIDAFTGISYYKGGDK